MNLFWIVLIVVGLVIVYYINKNYKKILVKINKLTSNKIDKINKRVDSEEEMFKQNSLAPKLLKGKELEKIQPYIDRLDESIRMPGVNNVALMSSYGAGKSTILRNFENQHEEYNYLNLSLGSYSTKEQEEMIDDKGNKVIVGLNEKLENSLVKQMIYREKKSKLPYSRFKKINNISKFKLSLFFLFEGISIVSLLFINNIFSFRKIMINNFQWVKNNINLIELICYALFLIGFLLLLFTFARTILRQFSISKLSVGNLAIEGNEANMSYFNKYIDEILYYFEINNFNVVVIEDVDRFGSIEVFEHLKELNLLLNNSKQIKRKITFIYAIKENVFSKSKVEEHESELRTKFFDLIIPVIPVIDTFNSRDYLLKLMEEKSENILSEDFVLFLKNISLFIYDLRILTNIVNEYETYLEVHNKIVESMSQQKLFSMITLKNLIPSEYIALQKSQGTIYDLLMGTKYEKMITKEEEEERQKIEIKISEIDEKIEKQKVRDAKLIFEKMGYYDVTKINLGKSWLDMINFSIDTIETIYNMDWHSFDIMYNEGAIVAINSDIYRNRLIEYNANEKNEINILISTKTDLSTRLDVLMHNKGNYSANSLEKNLKYYHRLKLLFEKEFENINDYNLILFLISNGYVAEDYSNYVSLYYDEGLRIRDKEYLIKLKSNQKIEFDYQFENIKEVLSLIDPFDFDNVGILNKDILITLSTDTGEKMDRIMNVFLTQTDDEIRTQLNIILSEDKDKTSRLLCRIMKEKYNNLAKIVKDKDEFSDRIIYSFQNIGNTRSNYVDYIGDIQRNISTRVDLFADLTSYGVKIPLFIESLDLYNKNNTEKILLDATLRELNEDDRKSYIDKNLYSLKNHTISEVLSEYSIEVENVSYNDILNSEHDGLIGHVDKNINQFVEETLLSKNVLNETEESFIDLINVAYKDGSKKDNFNELLLKFNSQITKLHEIDNTSLWNSILSNRKCKINWENMFCIINYNENEILSITKEDISIIIDVFDNVEKVSDLMVEYKFNSKKADEFYSVFIGKVDVEIKGSMIMFNYLEYSEDADFDDEIEKYNRKVKNKELVDLFEKFESVVE